MSKPKTILLVEDNPDDEMLVLRALQRSGGTHKVVVARDGVEALEYLFGKDSTAGKDCPDLPVLVLLDLKLPRMNGLEVLNKIRENERTHLLPVVMFTSSAEEVDIASSYALGVNSYVRKPVDYDRFNEAVNRIGTYWPLINELPN